MHNFAVTNCTERLCPQQCFMFADTIGVASELRGLLLRSAPAKIVTVLFFYKSDTLIILPDIVQDFA